MHIYIMQVPTKHKIHTQNVRTKKSVASNFLVQSAEAAVGLVLEFSDYASFQLLFFTLCIIS